MKENEATEQLATHWLELSQCGSVSPATWDAISNLIRRYGSKTIRAAMNVAWQEYSQRGEAEAFTKIGAFARIAYETARIPNARPLHYIRGIMRNRFGTMPEHEAMKFLRAADYAKVPLEELEFRAKSCQSYQDWVHFVQSHTGVKRERRALHSP